jgi:hypothetical protein
VIDRYAGSVDLPMIHAYGDITIYYDIYALFSSSSENVGSAILVEILRGRPTKVWHSCPRVWHPCQSLQPCP